MQRGINDDDADDDIRRRNKATLQTALRGCLAAAGVVAIGLLALVLVAVGLLVGLCGMGR